MSYYGDIRLGDTIDIKFTTRRFTTGAPFTLAGSPVVSAYVGNGTTEITAGITLSVDFDSRTGLNNVRVVATSGNGFATATNVQLVITAGTVDSVSVVGEVVGSFSIECRSALMPTTATRTLDVSAGGEAGVDWANVGSQDTAVTLTNTTVATVGVVNETTQVANGVSVGVGGIVTTSFAAGAINAAATSADFVNEIQSGLSTLTAAQVNTEVDTALSDINLDHLVKIAVDTDFPTTVHLNSVIGHLADNGTSASFDRTTDSLEELGGAGGGLTGAQDTKLTEIHTLIQAK